MAFSFVKTKTSSAMQPTPNSGCGNGINHNNVNMNNGQLSPAKLSSLRPSKIAIKQYPAWLRDGVSCLKQLPGVYHGVLGQVQLQPSLVMSDSNKLADGLERLVKMHQKADYLNRFTDTERVHQLLSTSRLSNEHLATIWAHVNKTFPGQLTNREVCLALAIIAVFQRLDREERDPNEPANDPFNLIKLEKKAPVPILYPTKHNSSPGHNSKLPASSSMPNDLKAGGAGLLIDIASDDSNPSSPIKTTFRACQSSRGLSASGGFHVNAINLIDNDSDIDADFQAIGQVWIRMMYTMKAVFKRTFDILNVENSRTSAIEALKSKEGIDFCKQLCLCYPIAHNIKSKLGELTEIQQRFETSNQVQHGDKLIEERCSQSGLLVFDKNYLAQMSDLMISINEYWAVLINLFHESGQTSFVELIMDGLNRDNKTVMSETLMELRDELNTFNKPDTCSICLTKFYLVNIGDAFDMKDVSHKDVELVLFNEPISEDDCYYYHPKCANFWLNNVQRHHPTGCISNLPFRQDTSVTEQILKPTSG